MFCKFGSKFERDEAVKCFSTERYEFNGKRVWISHDKPFAMRTQLSVLFAVKRQLVDWDVPGKFWVDDRDMSLTWNNTDLVLRTSISNEKLQVEFGDDWQEFLAAGNLQEVLQKARDSIDRSAVFVSKGKGKGQSKGKTPSKGFWGIDVDNIDQWVQ